MRSSTLKMILAVAGIWLFGLVIAVYAPEDILDESIIARTYVDAVKWCWPLMGQYVQKSKFPQLAMLYNSVVWLALPLLAILTWRYLKTRKTGLLVKEQLTIMEHLLLILACLFYAAIGAVFLFFWNGTNTRLVDFASSRLSLGLWGMAIPFGAAAFLIPVFACAKKIFTGKF